MKRLAFIFICWMVLLIPVSAVSIAAPVLTPEVESAMMDAFCNTYELDPDSFELKVEYYGWYDGCHVGFIDGGPFMYPTAERTVTIAGLDFVFPDYQQLMVCKDGAVKNLDNAYAAGWLSDVEVQRLWNYYTNGIYEENPNTGDEVWMPVMLLVASGAALLILIFRRAIIC